jgi:hypothetical protein
VAQRRDRCAKGFSGGFRNNWQPQAIARLPQQFRLDLSHSSRVAQTKLKWRPEMRILLQHMRNRLYFRRRGVWTSNLQAAFDFQRSDQALECARTLGLDQVQLAVKEEEQDSTQKSKVASLRATLG